MKIKIKFDRPFIQMACMTFIFFFISYFLYWNILMAAASILIGSMLTIVAYEKKEQEKKWFDMETSAYSFFDCFTKSIENSSGVKAAYELANRYLIGYQPAMTYEELLEKPSLQLFCQQKNFNLIIEKEKQNEAHLLFYRSLIEENEKTILKREKRAKQIQKSEKVCSLLALALPFLMLLFFIILDKAIPSDLIYLVSSFLALTFTLPLIYGFEYLGYKEMNHAR